MDCRDRDGDEALTPGPRLPAPQALNKLRHTKINEARSVFMEVLRLGTFAISEPLKVLQLKGPGDPEASPLEAFLQGTCQIQ